MHHDFVNPGEHFLAGSPGSEFRQHHTRCPGVRTSGRRVSDFCDKPAFFKKRHRQFVAAQGMKSHGQTSGFREGFLVASPPSGAEKQVFE